MNIPLSPQEASLLYSGAYGQQGQQASPSDPYGLGFPKAIESEIELVDMLHHLSKLLNVHQPDVSRSGPDMIERKEREKRYRDSSKTFRLSPSLRSTHPLCSIQIGRSIDVQKKPSATMACSLVPKIL